MPPSLAVEVGLLTVTEELQGIANKSGWNKFNWCLELPGCCPTTAQEHPHLNYEIL